MVVCITFSCILDQGLIVVLGVNDQHYAELHNGSQPYAQTYEYLSNSGKVIRYFSHVLLVARSKASDYHILALI